MRIKESLGRTVASMSAPPLLFFIAVVVWLAGSSTWITTIIALVAIGLSGVVLFDLPLALETDDLGLHRICVLRRHLIPWEEIESITKPRKRGVLLRTTKGKTLVLVDRTLTDTERGRLTAEAKNHGIAVEI